MTGPSPDAAEVPDPTLPIEWLPEQGRPEQLIVLMHGWAQDAQAWLPVAQALRDRFAQAAILAPQSPLAADGGRHGRQWYSIQGLEPGAEWRRRVDGAVERLVPWVRRQQQRLGVGGPATAIGGFSQGAVIALHMACAHDGLCGRVLGFGGRMVEPPEHIPRQTTFHLFHGSADRIFPVEHPRLLLDHLGQHQGDGTLDVAEGVGHEIHPALVDCLIHRLTSHIPLRTWQAALGAAPAGSEPAGDD